MNDGLFGKNRLMEAVDAFGKLTRETLEENQVSVRVVNYINHFDGHKYIITMKMSRFDFEQGKVENE